jgi:hypothetical protein
MIPECPKGKSRSFKSGWSARLQDKPRSSCRIKVNNGINGITWNANTQNWENNARYWDSLQRYQEWITGWLSCARQLGKIRKLKRLAEETKQINHEHDMLVDLAEELGL